MNEKIELIRQLAYYIWEREGRPPDRELQHWLEAESAVGTEEGQPGPGRKATKRSKGTVKSAATGKASAKKKTTKKTTKRTGKKS